MMLARVADTLYWIGRYLERAEHVCRLADVLLTATLDRSEASAQISRIALAAVGDPEKAEDPSAVARALVLDYEDPGSVASSLARARENARQVRDQITTETWERLNLVHLRLRDPKAARAFDANREMFLHDTVAELHLIRGATEVTMSHGEGWRFLLLGVYLERAQLIGALLEVCFGDHRGAHIDYGVLTALLRMACALEPYLRVYTADIQPHSVLEFLLLDEDFPHSLRFCTARIEEHLSAISRRVGAANAAVPDRLAGRLRARLQYIGIDEIEARGATAFLGAVLDECADVHQAVYDTFVAYPIERRLPA